MNSTRKSLYPERFDDVFVAIRHLRQGLAITVVGAGRDVQIARRVGYRTRHGAMHGPVRKAVNFRDARMAWFQADEVRVGRRLADGPSPSVDVANGTMPAATADDDPPLEPPGVFCGFQGLRVTPQA